MQSKVESYQGRVDCLNVVKVAKSTQNEKLFTVLSPALLRKGMSVKMKRCMLSTTTFPQTIIAETSPTQEVIIAIH